MVYPFAMHFKQAQCFCQSVSGGHHGEGAHLMSIHSEEDYAALEVAANKAGVTGAIFVGGHETAEGAWRWTDGTQLDQSQERRRLLFGDRAPRGWGCDFGSRHLWGRAGP